MAPWLYADGAGGGIEPICEGTCRYGARAAAAPAANTTTQQRSKDNQRVGKIIVGLSGNGARVTQGRTSLIGFGLGFGLRGELAIGEQLLPLLDGLFALLLG